MAHPLTSRPVDVATRLGVSTLKLHLASALPVLTPTGDVLYVPARRTRTRSAVRP